MRISDWSSDVCSSDLEIAQVGATPPTPRTQNTPAAFSPRTTPAQPDTKPTVPPIQQWMRSRRRRRAAATGSRRASSAWRLRMARGWTHTAWYTITALQQSQAPVVPPRPPLPLRTAGNTRNYKPEQEGEKGYNEGG